MEKKVAYIAPQINMTTIELEQGIAAGSAYARPEDANSGKVSEQWEVGSTDNRNIDW
jgi:pyruvoyl-dependent arginine decarboxylase (PvlArgDC)